MPDDLCPRCQLPMSEGRCEGCEAWQAELNVMQADLNKARVHALPPQNLNTKGARGVLKQIVFGIWVTPGAPLVALPWAKEASQEILGPRWYQLPADMQAGLLLTLLAPFEAAFFRTSGLTNGTAVVCFPQIYIDLLRQRFAAEINSMDADLLAGQISASIAEAGGRMFSDMLAEIVEQIEDVFAEAKEALTPVLVNESAEFGPETLPGLDLSKSNVRSFRKPPPGSPLVR